MYNVHVLCIAHGRKSWKHFALFFCLRKLVIKSVQRVKGRSYGGKQRNTAYSQGDIVMSENNLRLNLSIG